MAHQLCLDDMNTTIIMSKLPYLMNRALVEGGETRV